MKIIIKFNKKLSKWYIFINKYLFFVTITCKLKKIFFSIIFRGYYILLRILRQFGLIKPLKNNSTF